MFSIDIARHEIEALAEAELLKIAQGLVPDTPGDDDLKFARDYQPYFFGGAFPATGVDVIRSEGASNYVDAPDRPGVLIAQVMIYQEALSVRVGQSKQDDRTGPAKKNTRRIRGLFLEALFDERNPLCERTRVIESRGGSYDDVGNPVMDERGNTILWVDRSELQIAV